MFACTWHYASCKSHPLAFWLTQVSLAGNTTVNPPRGEAAGIQSEGDPASIEDGIQSEGEPASLEYVGVLFAASVSATLDSCAEASRRLTFTVDDPSCPPPPSPPPFVIDAAGGKADGISSESEPASFKDVIGDGGGTAVAAEGESAPMAPVKVGITLAWPGPRRAHARITKRLRVGHRRAASRTTTSS